MRFLLLITILSMTAVPASAQTETTITYQGQLQDAGGPFTGTPGMEFRLFDSLIDGNQIGAATVLSAVPVTDGLFQVELDFGATYESGPLYLEIMVSGNTLTPRQRIGSAPLAVAALNVPEISLADLACSAEEVAKWNGSAWDCASSVSAQDLQAERDRIDVLETENAALTSRVDDLEATVDGMATQLSALTSASQDHDTRLATIENSELLAREDFVVDLDEFLELHRTPPADTAVQGPILRLTGANFQIINAAQDQTTPDGTGNLVVGFAEARDFSEVCSKGPFDNQVDCEADGHIWAQAHNSGSHNIVGGEQAAYSQTGGIVLGGQNAITRLRAGVLSGIGNLASGVQSSVSGGQLNTASGDMSSVSAGSSNAANGNLSSVSGGVGNTASEIGSGVSGGRDNTASGLYSSVSGGRDCQVDSSYGWGAATLGDCQ
ncbi:hypothetical protein [Wenzhouxiangella sp. EGI_FJ10409]|uniref:hypothetical protein n=1 Tax=Wenzhouxiangella sp. EGI_FJ10409 TaxID=3243767 RepID=UPI0035D9724A